MLVMDSEIQRKIAFIGELVTHDPEIIVGTKTLIARNNHPDKLIEDKYQVVVKHSGVFELFKDWAITKITHTIRIGNCFYKFGIYMKDDSLNSVVIEMLDEYPVDDVSMTIKSIEEMIECVDDESMLMIISAPAGRDVAFLKDRYKDYDIKIINQYTHDIMLMHNFHAMHGHKLFNNFGLHPISTDYELFICLYIRD